MKALCPQCERMFDLSSHHFEDAILCVTCPSCHYEEQIASFIPSAVEGRTELSIPRSDRSSDRTWPPTPDSIPKHVCPKCLENRSADALSCRACGLVYDNYVSHEMAPSEVLREAWESLGSRWSDSTAHEVFIQLANTRDELALAGRLYRLALTHRPQDAHAIQGRDSVLRMAMAAASSVQALKAQEKPAKDFRPIRWILGVALVFLGLMFFFLQRQFLEQPLP